MFMYDYFARFELYYEKTTFMMMASIIGAGLNIVLNYIFIQKYGYIAAGYTTLVCYIFYVAGHYYMMRKICNEHLKGANAFQLRVIVVISVAFMASGFLAMSTYRYIYMRYGLLVIALAVCFWKREKIKTNISIILHLKKEVKAT